MPIIPGFPGATAIPIWRLASSKLARVICATFFVLGLTLLWLQYYSDFLGGNGITLPHAQGEARHDSLKSANGRLHLLIPATSTNVDFCKLLLSSQILGYPTPILINYGDPEAADEYVQHLAKVEGILKYLDSLEDSDEEHLILIIDGYDIWFQLRPDVLIKRYFALNAAADTRNRRLYGDKAFEEHDMRQTVIFSQDKICWPIDVARPACWAVPDATLSRYAFGPETNADSNGEFNMPSWLNSGSILGPANDLKDIFRTTLEEIHVNHTTDSDQFYFANVFGDQEFARLSTNPALVEAKKAEVATRPGGDVDFYEPEQILDGRKVEYHIGIDYASHLFQTFAFWKQALTFTRAVDAWTSSSGKTWGLQLPPEISSSAPPFAALTEHNESSWSEISLNYNTITDQAPVLLHFTGEKRFRGAWWTKMWFQSRAEQLHDAIRKYDQHILSPEPIGGVRWRAAEPEDAEDISERGKMGAYTDRRGWLSWRGLCKTHEWEIFNNEAAVTVDHPVFVEENA